MIYYYYLVDKNKFIVFCMGGLKGPSGSYTMLGHPGFLTTLSTVIHVK